MGEFDIYRRDYIKLNFLNEAVNSKSVMMNVFLETDGVEKAFLDIRSVSGGTYRFNNFSVTEDAAENSITFRPIVIGCLSYIRLVSDQKLKIDVIKNGTDTPAGSFDIMPGEAKIVFDPKETMRYEMRVEQLSSGNPREDVRKLEESTADLEQRIETLAEHRKDLEAHLEKLQAEYKKNYAGYESDVREIKDRYDVDEEIILMYADKEVEPIEELIRRASRDVSQMEEQLRTFIEAKAKKAAEIDEELSIGKKE